MEKFHFRFVHIELRWESKQPFQSIVSWISLTSDFIPFRMGGNC